MKRPNWWKEIQINAQELKGAAGWLSFLAITDLLILNWPATHEIPAEIWKPWADSLSNQSKVFNSKYSEKRWRYKEVVSPRTSFYFNPMTVSADSLKLLGIKPWIADRFVRFREKGGRFYQPEDFDQLYGLKPADRQLLIEFARFPNKIPEGIDKKRTPLGVENRAERTPSADLRRVALNESDSSEWERLPGIGPVLASRIIKYRNRLGGFVNRTQLLEVYGFDSVLYLRIVSKLQEISKPDLTLNWESAAFDSLARHPYIGRYLANKIVRYREQNKRFPERMRPENWLFIDSAKLEKLRPYLSKP